MLKKIFLITLTFGLTACDNVDISRYPESVQKCYNGIIYENNNCTHSKKKILRYCECTTAQEGKINAKAEELNQGLRGMNALSTSMNATWGSFFRAGARNNAQGQLEKYTQGLYDECAKKTGYTRIKNCKKSDKNKDKK